MATVQEFFEGLSSRVTPDRIEGMNNTYVFDIEGAGVWTVTIADGSVTVADGAGDADCTFSTTRFEISSAPVLAVMVTPHVTSVPAFVMKSFEPLTTHEPSRSSAVVRVAPASEPASASVRPKAASFSPDARSGSQRSFCSSEP